MSDYFKYFPKIQHDIKNIGQSVTLTNILRRFIVRTDVQDRTDVFYEYQVQEGDRPDTIASKYYDDADLAWIVLHYNNIQDPYFEWPLFGSDFTNYIKTKYGSVPNAQQGIYEYRQVLNEPSVRYDGTKIKKRYLVIDQETYNTLSEIDRESITNYDYEVERNDRNREIRILDKKYINRVSSELKNIVTDGIV